MSFLAQYPGTCDDCGDPIVVGQELTYHADEPRPVHISCHGIDRLPSTPLCGQCFTYHNGECL